jgi:DNA helicase-2/ATP-dependent DNA helicase PcrA
MMLTKEQKQIIESTDQHILVVANAGCGKTSTLIEKVKHLIEVEKVDPTRILLTSFSKVANEEILEKLTKRLGVEVAENIYLGTMHSMCYRIILECGSYLGIETLDMVNESYLALTAFNLALESGQDFSLSELQDEVYTFRKNLISKPDAQEAQRGEVRLLFEQAQDKIEKSGKLLFDDLLLKTVYLLEHFPEIREKCQNKFDYLIIDEGQDTSYTQWQIVSLFLREDTKTCVVGDVKQNIYAFRGASYEYMDDFRKSVNSTVLPLSETFRFGQPFADLSNKLVRQLEISDIYKQETKTNVTCSSSPSFKTGASLAQVDYIVKDIEQQLAEGKNLGDINIIYRYNSEAIPFIKPLIKKGIPFKVKAADFFDRPELKFLVNAYNLATKNFTISDCALLFDQYPNYVGHETLSSLYRDYKKIGGKENSIISFLEFTTKDKRHGIGKAKLEALEEITNRFKAAKHYLDKQNGKVSLQKLADCLEIKETKFFKSSSKDEDTDNAAKEYNSYINLFQDLFQDSGKQKLDEWYTEALLNGSKTAKDVKNAIQLKTIHGSKGQSLPTVYLLLNKIASPVFCKTDEDLLNEMFVLYVALTRAESKLEIFIQDSRKFPFGYLLPAELEQLSGAAAGSQDNPVFFKLKTNYLADEYSFPNKLKKEVQLARNTDNAVQIVLNSRMAWVPLRCIAYSGEYYFINDWILKKNNLQSWIEVN